MWCVAWNLGVGFAVPLATMNAMWGENQTARALASDNPLDKGPPT